MSEGRGGFGDRPGGVGGVHERSARSRYDEIRRTPRYGLTASETGRSA